MSIQAQGMRSWLLQRLTAVYIIIFSLSFILWFSFQETLDYNIWLALFSQPFVLGATVLFYISLFLHARVGMRDIFLDYIKPNGLRFIVLMSLDVALIAMTIWIMIIFVSLVKI